MSPTRATALSPAPASPVPPAPSAASPLAPPTAADASDFLGGYGGAEENSGLMSPSGLGAFDDEDAGEEDGFYNASDDMDELFAVERVAYTEAAVASAAAPPEQLCWKTRRRTAANAAAEPEQKQYGTSRGPTAAGDAAAPEYGVGRFRAEPGGTATFEEPPADRPGEATKLLETLVRLLKSRRKGDDAEAGQNARLWQQWYDVKFRSWAGAQASGFAEAVGQHLKTGVETVLGRFARENQVLGYEVCHMVDGKLLSHLVKVDKTHGALLLKTLNSAVTRGSSERAAALHARFAAPTACRTKEQLLRGLQVWKVDL